jgi:RNA polymerase sigma-70 factor (ECF subfamily)
MAERLITEQKNIDERALVQAAKQDPGAFGELYQIYVQQVFRYLYSRIGNVQEAEDVTGQTFLAAFESITRFRQDGHFASWLFRIARNKAMDHFRRAKRVVSVEDMEELPAKDDPTAGIIQTEQVQRLALLLEQLYEGERELLRLRFLADMSFGEIAHLLKRKEDTVKKTIYRLLARLHSQAEDDNE